jgi:hypothetical protein
MADKGYRSGRTSAAHVAFGGSGSGANTSLSKFEKPKSSRLEDIVANSSDTIIKHREAIAKTSLKFLYPEGYYGYLLAKTLYKHKDRIYRTIDDVARIWSEEGSISEKIVKSGTEILKTGAHIAKEEIKEKFVRYVSSRFSEAVVNKLDDSGVIDKVAHEVKLDNHAERFKDLLEDTIEKQTADTLEELIGDM